MQAPTQQQPRRRQAGPVCASLTPLLLLLPRANMLGLSPQPQPPSLPPSQGAPFPRPASSHRHPILPAVDAQAAAGAGAHAGARLVRQLLVGCEWVVQRDVVVADQHKPAVWWQYRVVQYK